jgi:hypothetical protein
LNPYASALCRRHLSEIGQSQRNPGRPSLPFRECRDDPDPALVKAAARADVEKLKERFRQELGGHDFTLEEILLDCLQTTRKPS